MLRVALTGGIATGKSTVARVLRDDGIAVVDADDLARRVVAPGTPGFARVVARFGPAVVSPDGDLDRRALGALVFVDRAARRDLEGLIHPHVQQGIETFFGTVPPGSPGVAEIPLLFETGRQEAFDVVVATLCRPETQRARLAARSQLAPEAVDERLAAQWPAEDKARLADVVVWTDGALADTARQVHALAAWLRGRAR